MFFKRTNQIVDLLSDHMNAVTTCYDYYTDGFKEIVKLQSNNEIHLIVEFSEKLNRMEHEADVIRHNVITELLAGGMLAENRKSTMRLLEGIDTVADISEDVVKMIAYENITISNKIHEQLCRINKITNKQLKSLVHVYSGLMTKYELDDLVMRIRGIENLESDIDNIEKEVLKYIFDSDLELAEKLHIKQLVLKITSMSDLIEDLSDEIEIILSSRVV